MNDMTKTTGPRVVTFGCRLNSFESEVMRGHAQTAGLNDAIIVNTCAVTAEAERQARQMIRKLRRENPDATIIVTGCAAQINPERYAMAEVDRVLGNAEKMKPESYAPNQGRISVAAAADLKETARHLIGGFDGKSRAFAEIQQGCDHQCTFCIIPKGRGPNRSAMAEDIIRQIKSLVDKGFAEIVLTGVDICSYGADGEGGSLAALTRRILTEIPELPRLRLTSLDPAAVDDDLIGLIGDHSRLMPHFHLSVQAGDDLILRRMKRRHNRDDVLRLVEKLREVRPGCAIGADLIAGFPTESDAMFENGAALVKEAGFSHLHVFPYSPRPDTPAANLPQLDRRLIKGRAKALRLIGKEQADAFRAAQIGKIAEVLVETGGMGHSAHYLPVSFDGAHRLGDIVSLLITGVDNDRLIGEDVS